MTNPIGPKREAEQNSNDQRLREKEIDRQKEKEREWRGERESLASVCVFTCMCAACERLFDSVRGGMRGNTFISHARVSHRAASTGVLTLLSNTNQGNHLPNLQRGCVWQSVSLITRLLTGRAE